MGWFAICSRMGTVGFTQRVRSMGTMQFLVMVYGGVAPKRCGACYGVIRGTVVVLILLRNSHYDITIQYHPVPATV